MIRCDESTSLEDLSNGVLVHRIPRGETEGGENESFGPLNVSLNIFLEMRTRISALHTPDRCSHRSWL